MEDGDSFKMILIVNVCREKLHYLEFVKPITDIFEENNKPYFVKDYKKITKKDLQRADKAVICGTSLMDDEFINNLPKFAWVKFFDKPILGICAGMQVIGLMFGSKLRKKTEIGFFKEEFKRVFLGMERKQEVYHLHNFYVSLPRGFEKFTKSEVPQAIKHTEKEIYGVLFHPEVRQKDLINVFVK